MKKIAIISAMEIELSYVDEYLKNQHDWKKDQDGQYSNSKKNLQIYTKVLGVGKVNAAYQTADLITAFHPDLVINVGYAGGLITNAKRGDIAIGTEYVQVDFAPYLEANRPNIAPSPAELTKRIEKEAADLGIHAVSGKIATGDFFLHDTEQKKEIIDTYHPVAFDMESAAIAQVTTSKGVDFESIRVFSDLADDDAPKALEEEKNINRIPIEERPVVLALRAIDNQL